MAERKARRAATEAAIAALRSAAKSGRFERLGPALEAAMRAGALNQETATMALSCASIAGPLESVEALLAAGADPEGEGRGALRGSAASGREDILRRMLELLPGDGAAREALGLAAGMGALGCVRLLMERLEPQTRLDGALALAASSKSVECVREILPRCAAAAAGGKALGWAAEAGAGDCVRELIRASGWRGETLGPLLAAADNGRQECVGILLEAGWPGFGRGGAEAAAQKARLRRREDLALWIEGLALAKEQAEALEEALANGGAAASSGARRGL